MLGFFLIRVMGGLRAENWGFEIKMKIIVVIMAFEEV